MTERIHNVLFLCTGNSARSILAESILSKDGAGRFRAYSAGSQPKGEVHPLALEVLRAMDYPTQGFRSKSWDEFAAEDAPVMDFIFTVCDGAAGEACPLWIGRPITAHWGIADPAAVQGDEAERKRAFVKAAQHLKHRISRFVNLPFDKIDMRGLASHLDEIGRAEGASSRRQGSEP